MIHTGMNEDLANGTVAYTQSPVRYPGSSLGTKGECVTELRKKRTKYCDHPNLTCARLYGMVAGKPLLFLSTVPIAEAWGVVRPVALFSSNMEVSGHSRTIETCNGLDESMGR